MFLVPSNFFAVTSLRKAAEILETVNGEAVLARECRDLADEVEAALHAYATVEHPKYGTIYAYEVDGFGNKLLMDDANDPSHLALAYLGDVDKTIPYIAIPATLSGVKTIPGFSAARRVRG